MSEIIRTVGRRKEAAARVRLTDASPEIVINGRPLEKYFTSAIQRQSVEAPLKLVGLFGTTGASAKVAGGGVAGQAEAVRHGIARALVVVNPDFRKTLKAVGYLRRDPRAKERKKFGLKKARRASQWAKR